MCCRDRRGSGLVDTERACPDQFVQPVFLLDDRQVPGQTVKVGRRFITNAFSASQGGERADRVIAIPDPRKVANL